VVERWLNLARIEVQTASGSAHAEMTLEGLHEFEAVRDFLYAKMRGNRDRTAAAAGAAAPAESGELAVALREVTAELRAVRRQLERREADGD
jgi:putative membrane protein